MFYLAAFAVVKTLTTTCGGSTSTGPQGIVEIVWKTTLPEERRATVCSVCAAFTGYPDAGNSGRKYGDPGVQNSMKFFCVSRRIEALKRRFAGPNSLCYCGRAGASGPAMTPRK